MRYSAFTLLSLLLGTLVLMLAGAGTAEAQFTCDKIPTTHYPSVKRCLMACEKYCHYRASYCMSAGCKTNVATKTPTTATPGKHKHFTRARSSCRCVLRPLSSAAPTSAPKKP